MKRSKSSSRWIQDHENDEFVARARREGYRSRATYKLLEIADKHQILKTGDVVVDLGAAPGGWSQVASERVGPRGYVLAVDLLEIEPIEGVDILAGDFTEESVLSKMMAHLGDRAVDLVISDMAPNLSGVKDIDQPRAMYLVELALDFAETVLRPGGTLLTKVFEGEGIDDLRGSIRSSFKSLKNVKPKASRGKSREIYLLATGFKGRP